MRTITVGTVLHPWFVMYYQWGVPGGYFMAWRGRDHPFLEAEFMSWNDLERAVRGRCRVAGLRAGRVWLDGEKVRVEVSRFYR